MFDIDEIRKQALASMRETMEKNEERISKIEVPSSEKGASVSAAEVEEQIAANTQRQVEILGQMFGPDKGLASEPTLCPITSARSAGS